jgi:AmmeMemoRadiSam system protein B
VRFVAEMFLMQCPKLRPISAFPVELSDGQYVCVQDPHHHLEQPLVVSPETFFVLQFFDGQSSFEEIQEAFERRFGAIISPEEIQHIAGQCDDLMLLDSPAFSEHLHKLRSDFARLPVRPSSHQGAAYPDDPDQLTHNLERYFMASKGPGKIPNTNNTNSAIKAIMAPHIDFEAGGATFAWTYNALAASDADLFIILGTSHVDMQNFFALTRKGFATPFGTLETHQEFVETLAEVLPYDPFEDELIHKSEHSIEFQVVFLQYLFRHRPINIVPILCGGSMAEAVYHKQPLDQTPQLEDSIAALHQVLQKYPQACVVASVDFSHIGVRYGHQVPPAPATLQKVEELDRALLQTMETSDHKGFAERLYDTGNVTQVCGIVPIYTMLRVIEGMQGSLLHYDCVELSPGSFVSFASMVWKEKK